MEQKRRRVEHVPRTIEARLRSLVDSQGLSYAALRRVVAALTEDPISRRNLSNIAKDRYNQVAHRLRLPGVSGGDVTIPICHPMELLALLVRENMHIRSWFEEAWRSQPSSRSSPWRLLIGWDEFVPGNKQALQNSRKTMVLSFSFLELANNLHQDAAWITPLAIRASVVRNVRGGWSAVLRAFLRLLLMGPLGLHGAGYPISVFGQLRLLFARVQILISDGDGLRQALQWLGASALKPCFRHWNVFNPQSDLADRCPSARRYVEATCADASLFCTWSGDDMRTAADILVLARQRHEAGDIPFARVDEIQKAYGFKFTADGLVADRELGAIIDWPSAFHYDWVRVMLAGGVLMSATWSLLKALDAAGLPGQAALHAFLDGWRCPRAAQSGSRDVGRLGRFFDERSRAENSKREGLRRSASELLAVARAVGEFALTQVPDDHRVADHKAFFLAARRTVDVLMQVKRGQVTPTQGSSDVEMSSREQMARAIALLGEESITRKFHWSFDVAQQMRSSDYLADAFIIERLHLRARDIANRVYNTTAYEASICAGLVNRQASGEGTLGGLEGDQCQMPVGGLEHVLIADRMYFHSKRFASDDILQRGQEIGRVVACAKEHDELALIVDVCALVTRTSRVGRRCRWGGQRQVWLPSDAHVAAAWKETTVQGELHVLMQ